jgi:hypothetical protein
MRQAIVTALRERFERALQDGDLPAGLSFQWDARPNIIFSLPIEDPDRVPEPRA